MSFAAASGALFSEHPAFVHPSGDLVAWLTDPPGIVVQFARPAVGSRALVEWLLERVEPMFSSHFEGRNDLIFVLDLSQMTARESAARSLLLERAPAFRGRFSRTFIVLPNNAGKLLSMSIHAAAALLRTFGIPVAVERSIELVQQTCRLRAVNADLASA